MAVRTRTLKGVYRVAMRKETKQNDDKMSKEGKMSLNTKISNRRDFIKVAVATGAVAALAATLSPTLKALAATDQSVSYATASDNGMWKPTTCQGCTSWCSSEVSHSLCAGHGPDYRLSPRMATT